MIRDTSAQDRVMTAPSNRRKQFVWIGLGLATLVAIGLCVPTVARLMSADSSASSARLRIAEVKRGDLVRDVSVQGRVVAAVSPTLYARTAGTVTLDVHAGDKVKKDDVLAEIDSPELTNPSSRNRRRSTASGSKSNARRSTTARHRPRRRWPTSKP